MTDNIIQRALRETKILRRPNQKIETFWSTEIDYFIISQTGEGQSCLRKGTVICAKPRIISRQNFAETFRGFSDEAVRFAEEVAGSEIQRLRMLGYSFENNLHSSETMQLPAGQLIENVQSSVQPGRTNTAVVTTSEDIWSVSLLKVVMEVISRSFLQNMEELEERGFFNSEGDNQRTEIEAMFGEARHDKKLVRPLGDKLQEYNLFKEYEERFFSLVDLHKEPSE